jgi:hypothetical protein
MMYITGVDRRQGQKIPNLMPTMHSARRPCPRCDLDPFFLRPTDAAKATSLVCAIMILEPFTIRAPHDGIVDHRSPPEAKIALFRTLFRGREDVYPRRFESRKTGKTGYQPVCANEWVQGICEKPRIKCTDCTYQRGTCKLMK